MTNFHISYKIVTSSEFNEHLEIIKNREYTVIWFSYEDAIKYDFIEKNPFVAYIKIGIVNISLTYKRGKKWINIKHNLSGPDIQDMLFQETDPKVAYQYFQRYAHIQDHKGEYGYTEFEDKVYWNITNLGALRFFNVDYIGQRLKNCICYDMNSAFLTACKNLPLPDTTELIAQNREVRTGEVGFNENGFPIYGPKEKVCAYIFKTYINDGLEKWVDKIYDHKKNAKDKFERKKWKDLGNFAIGYIARHNPFVRNCIIYKSNITMMNLMNNDTLMCNTDNIVSIKERKDIKIGDKLGDFKIEHSGNFAISETGYQWNNDMPTISGFTKEKTILFREIVGRDYDILKDGNLDDIFIAREFDPNELIIRDRNILQDYQDYLRGIYEKKL